MTTLTGYDAIEYAETHGLSLSKYNDPTEGARDGLSVGEARKVASEDPSLIYIELPMIYTYTIFDADPQTSSGTAWPSHQDIEIAASSDDEAIELVRSVMSAESAGLNPSDGYDVGQSLYAIVWDADGIIVGEPTYELTASDLGTEDQDDDDWASIVQ